MVLRYVYLLSERRGGGEKGGGEGGGREEVEREEGRGRGEGGRRERREKVVIINTHYFLIASGSIRQNSHNNEPRLGCMEEY